ncbi:MULTISPECIES: transporter substrate-binding domain-containing protein [Pseudomonas]|jgi:polar amino acid transport system substrate-binding protein|uniref:substrate-binding periplasmic protein n=1 Tax=unclassified Pseudomonas TaxID=196821 RepID=UPI000854131F|nr:MULTISPECIES: transporter substrate-binding domain-containing protein [Pseudomonas]MAB97898.1 amino acid ABC transporter substrate-binding protein [Pseudomonadaceae bacterium]NRH26980.1 amino acid ABC transporter substrate-binding protein [Pseudomonas sp. MS19]OEO23585.1 amino acid ABC transporter substrate-binding protein [Pseudomonas sp. J237]
MLYRLLARPLVALICVLSMPAAMAEMACERMVATGQPDYPPFLWRDPQNPKRLIGAQADLLAHLGKELGIRIDVVYSSSKAKAESEVSSGRVDLLAGASITPQDLEHLDIVYPALFQQADVVWVRNILSFPYIEWADLRERRGASVGMDFSPAFKAYASENLSLEQGANLAQLFDKLMAGELDYVVAEREPGQLLANSKGLAKDLLALSPPIESTGLHLAISHNSACNTPWLRGQLAKKMTELAATELPQAWLEQNYILWQQHVLQAASTTDSPSNQ